METPLSSRRVTRSQTLAAAAAGSANNIPMSKKIEEGEKNLTKSRQRSGRKQEDRSALIDITNDSPIVGLAMGSLETPSSAMSKKRNNRQIKQMATPGSGEALLRGQVKTLLQKVEEEAEPSKIPLVNRPLFNLKSLLNSPGALLAPTPANTPQILNFSAGCNDLPSVTPTPVGEDKFVISQMVNDVIGVKSEECIESEKSLITRSLLQDFSEKSESMDSSESCLEEQQSAATDDDDDASVWSIQVNATSTQNDDDEEEGEEFEEEDCESTYAFEEEDVEYGGELDELCEGMSKMCVDGTKFAGKHTRFIYNSDGELQGVEEVSGVKQSPERKHLHFPTEDEEEAEH